MINIMLHRRISVIHQSLFKRADGGVSQYIFMDELQFGATFPTGIIDMRVGKRCMTVSNPEVATILQQGWYREYKLVPSY